jgi:hypothetical protein
MRITGLLGIGPDRSSGWGWLVWGVSLAAGSALAWWWFDALFRAWFTLSERETQIRYMSYLANQSLLIGPLVGLSAVLPRLGSALLIASSAISALIACLALGAFNLVATLYGPAMLVGCGFWYSRCSRGPTGGSSNLRMNPPAETPAGYPRR